MYWSSLFAGLVSGNPLTLSNDVSGNPLTLSDDVSSLEKKADDLRLIWKMFPVLKAATTRNEVAEKYENLDKPPDNGTLSSGKF